MYAMINLKNFLVIYEICGVIMLSQFIDCHVRTTTTTTATTATITNTTMKPTITHANQRQTHWQHKSNRSLTSAAATTAKRATTTKTTMTSATTRNSNFPFATINSNCKEEQILTNIHEYTKTLIALNSGQSRRLDNIEKKLVQFEGNNLAQLELLNVQQKDFQKHIDMLSHMQRLTRQNVESVMKEFEEFVQKLNYTNWIDTRNYTTTQNNDVNVERYARQTSLPEASGQWNISDNLSNAEKLDALAVFLVSTRGALSELQNTLQMNISRLLQQTGNLQRRFNNFVKRQQQQFQRDNNGGYSSHYLYGNHASNTPHNLITNCAQSVSSTLGILKLQLTRISEPFYVMCDDQLLGGGWTIILNRFSGDINFERGWLDYKQGFGNLAGEFFIGLDKLHALTNANDVNELLIVLEDFQGNRRYARYNLFAIGSEQELYDLKLLGQYSGDAGDSLSYHAGNKFSTFDNDNDGCVDCNCAQSHRGAWWYNWCDQSNLMGPYYAVDYDKIEQYRGMYWQTWLGPNYSLRAVRMMIRPVNYEQDQR